MIRCMLYLSVTLALLACEEDASVDPGAEADAMSASTPDGAETPSEDAAVDEPDEDAAVDEPDEDAAVDEPDEDAAVEAPEGLCEDDPADMERPAHWTRASHCKGEPPDYDYLFDDAVVRHLTLTMTPEVYAEQIADVTSLQGGPGGVTSEPMWVPVDLTYDGQAWTEVGMRYKGNSSLMSAVRSGVRKLSFRLNFDKYEDDHPELDNQRFYGFKKMTFSNAYKDPSLMRDKIAADLFRAGGVPAARGAFVAVSLDAGDGLIYLGLYTMIEDPADELIGVQFEDDSGNLYKPDGDAAAWTHFSEDEFEKKTNEGEADFSDVQAAIQALHADRSDAAAWRAGLEAALDVDSFLRWLALNQAMVNWDTYGSMTHNYYLYGDPAQGGRLVWFPWDLNEALIEPGRVPGGGDPTSLTLDRIDDSWPLIRFLLDDEVYWERYLGFLADARGVLEPEALIPRLEATHALISPYIVGPEAEEVAPYTNLDRASEFTSSVSGGLAPHIEGRYEEIGALLGQ